MKDCADCANANMRAEAAEALLAELRAECEDLRAKLAEAEDAKAQKAQNPKAPDIQHLDFDVLEKYLAGHRSAAQMRAAFDEEYRQASSYYEKWPHEEMERMKNAQRSSAMAKLTRKPTKSPPTEKDWNRKSPPQNPPRKDMSARNSGDYIAVTLTKKHDGRIMSIAVDAGARRVVAEMDTRLIQKGGGYTIDFSRNLLRQFGAEPPNEVVAELAAAIREGLSDHGYF